MFTKLRGYRIAAPGAILALICFFLPWVLVSCGNQPPQSFTGWQLMTRTTVDSTTGAEKFAGNLFVGLLFLAALAVLALAFLAWRRGHLNRLDSYGVLGLSALSLLYLFLQFGGKPAEGSTKEILYGLWGVVLGYIAILAGGIMNWVERRRGN